MLSCAILGLNTWCHLHIEFGSSCNFDCCRVSLPHKVPAVGLLLQGCWQCLSQMVSAGMPLLVIIVLM